MTSIQNLFDKIKAILFNVTVKVYIGMQKEQHYRHYIFGFRQPISPERREDKNSIITGRESYSDTFTFLSSYENYLIIDFVIKPRFIKKKHLTTIH